MSAQDSSASWEDGLTAIDDEQEATEYAKGAVHEPLAEAHRRAKRVVELEQSRPNPRPTVVAHAQKSVDVMEQAMGMWR
ncbi:MAG TPA: hypothetical protein VFR49_02090 [Solirubrobacteraceae bacterium]|nr:hypothetical protein [Solirubrobacteraceae bacterium]